MHTMQVYIEKEQLSFMCRRVHILDNNGTPKDHNLYHIKTPNLVSPLCWGITKVIPATVQPVSQVQSSSSASCGQSVKNSGQSVSGQSSSSVSCSQSVRYSHLAVLVVASQSGAVI